MRDTREWHRHRLEHMERRLQHMDSVIGGLVTRRVALVADIEMAERGLREAEKLGLTEYDQDELLRGKLPKC